MHQLVQAVGSCKSRTRFLHSSYLLAEFAVLSILPMSHIFRESQEKAGHLDVEVPTFQEVGGKVES